MWDVGEQKIHGTNNLRLFGEYYDNNGFPNVYKVFCFDIDEKNAEVPPFSYGMRADGKIIAGARVRE